MMTNLASAPKKDERKEVSKEGEGKARKLAHT